MKNIDDKLIEKYHALKLAPNHSSHHASVAVASSSCNEVVKGNNKVLNSIKVKRKGKPPSKQKVPIIEIVAKKSQVLRKPPSDNNAKQKKRKKKTSWYMFFPYNYKYVHFP
jgi:hypothetical protein